MTWFNYHWKKTTPMVSIWARFSGKNIWSGPQSLHCFRKFLARSNGSIVETSNFGFPFSSRSIWIGVEIFSVLTNRDNSFYEIFKQNLDDHWTTWYMVKEFWKSFLVKRINKVILFQPSLHCTIWICQKFIKTGLLRPVSKWFLYQIRIPWTVFFP